MVSASVGRVKNTWCIYTWGYYSAIKRLRPVIYSKMGETRDVLISTTSQTHQGKPLRPGWFWSEALCVYLCPHRRKTKTDGDQGQYDITECTCVIVLLMAILTSAWDMGSHEERREEESGEGISRREKFIKCRKYFFSWSLKHNKTSKTSGY